LYSYFIFARTAELKRYGKTVGAGSTFVEVSGKQMEKMNIAIPEYAEQEVIGRIFCALDCVIANYSGRATKLEQLKTTLLQQMHI
jgi:type I restriction enzyme S subunit